MASFVHYREISYIVGKICYRDSPTSDMLNDLNQPLSECDIQLKQPYPTPDMLEDLDMLLSDYSVQQEQPYMISQPTNQDMVL